MEKGNLCMKIKMGGKWIAALAAIALCMSVAACGGSVADVDVNKAADAIKSGTTFTDELTKTDTENAEKLYQVDASLVQDVCVYIGTGATPEEIAVWKAKDDNGAAKLKEAAQGRLDTQKQRFTDYNPEQMPKIESAVLEESGKTVVLCISADNDKAKTAVSQALKG